MYNAFKKLDLKETKKIFLNKLLSKILTKM